MKQIYVKDQYVTCMECALNDSGSGRTFCQEFSMHIDPRAEETNKDRAMRCAFYVPKGCDRKLICVPKSERWYEKDSMA